MTDAIEAGIDCLEHCYFVEDSHIEQMLKKGTHVCLTMSEYFTIKEHMPAAMAAKFEKYRPIVHMAMEKLRELDAVAYVRFASVHREFKDVETFMKELQTLKSEEKD